jgi:hypothetical protein
MTISTWLLIFAFAVGSGPSQPIESSASCPIGDKCKIASNCWINGTWYNPCPEPDPGEQPDPPMLPPT